PVADDTDYVWGDPISDLSQIEPGDILQIRDHLITTKIKIEYLFKDGSTIVEKDERTAQRGHHTAIVNGKLDANGGVKTLEPHLSISDSPSTRPRVHQSARHPVLSLQARSASLSASGSKASTDGSGRSGWIEPSGPTVGGAASVLPASASSRSSAPRVGSSTARAASSRPANHSAPSNTACAASAREGSSTATVSGKCRPTRSTLGISTPAQPLWVT